MRGFSTHRSMIQTCLLVRKMILLDSEIFLVSLLDILLASLQEKEKESTKQMLKELLENKQLIGSRVSIELQKFLHKKIPKT